MKKLIFYLIGIITCLISAQESSFSMSNNRTFFVGIVAASASFLAMKIDNNVFIDTTTWQKLFISGAVGTATGLI